MSERDGKIAAAAFLMVAGGIIGAGLALLLAPQSGSRTRRDLARTARKLRRRTDTAVDDLAGNISELVDSISDKTDELVEKGRDVAGGARKDLIRLIEEGAARLEKFRTKLSRM
jgi:gas vesicle protein